MELVKCKCGANIHPERIEYGYETCVDCSTEQGYVGVLEFGHKTGGYLVKTRSDDEESVRRMWRAFHRSR